MLVMEPTARDHAAIQKESSVTSRLLRVYPTHGSSDAYHFRECQDITEADEVLLREAAFYDG